MATATSKLKRASTNGTPVASATTTTVVAAPGAGAFLRVKKIVASNGGATATWVSWKENAGTTYYQKYLTQGGEQHVELPRPWDLAANKALELVTSAAGSVEYTVEYEVVVL